MGNERHLLNLGNDRERNGQEDQENDRPLNPREQQLNAGNQQMGRGGLAPQNGENRPPLVAGGEDPLPGPLDADEKRQVIRRAVNRGIILEDRNIRGGEKAKVNTDPNKSMAADPQFEARASRWEMRFGGVVNEDQRTKTMADRVANYVKNYMEARVEMFEDQIDQVLPEVGADSQTISGAVGKQWKKVAEGLDNGSVSTKMLHFQNFADSFLKGDIEKLGAAGVGKIVSKATGEEPTAQLDDTMAKVESTKNKKKKARMQNPKAHAKEQWHARGERVPGKRTEKDLKKDRENILGEELAQNVRVDEAVKAKLRENKQFNDHKDQSKRTYGEFKAGTQMDFSGAEKEHMELEGEGMDGERLKINEGGERWAINETDKWVKFIRDMSLPLLAGPSGTTARLMEAMNKFGLNNQPAHSRLPIMAYILPNRHHSLVEIMAGAAKNGGPAFNAHPGFYREIEPFEPGDLRAKMGMPFPDEPEAATTNDETEV